MAVETESLDDEARQALAGLLAPVIPVAVVAVVVALASNSPTPIAGAMMVYCVRRLWQFGQASGGMRMQRALAPIEDESAQVGAEKCGRSIRGKITAAHS